MKFFALLPKWIQSTLRDWYLNAFGYATTSYSQEGEDMVLARYFTGLDTGFYVDVGAHHPKRFSNTYMFYRKGWRGINIDAMPGAMRAFRRMRPLDINVECAVGARAGMLTYFMFNEPALNGFSERLSSARHGDVGGYRIVDETQVRLFPLSELLNTHLPHGMPIDFLNVDVEGLDDEVLRSNDWVQYRPRLVLVEMLYQDLEQVLTTETGRFMREHDYVIYAKTVNTVFFEDSRASRS